MKIIAMATFSTNSLTTTKTKQFGPQEKILVIEEWFEDVRNRYNLGELIKLN